MTLIWDYKSFGDFNSSEKGLKATLKELISRFKRETSDQEKPTMSLPFIEDDLDNIMEHANRISANFEHVLILAVGGSSLGGQALVEACGPYEGKLPNLVFCDNLSADGFPYLLSTINPQKTHIIAISKSGGTIEPLLYLSVAMEWLKDASCSFKDHITVITEPRTSILRTLVEAYDLPCLDHIIPLGGRFAVLSNVGLLPAAILGVDIHKVRIGAQNILNEMKRATTPLEVPSVLGAVHIVSHHKKDNINISVMLPYENKLRKFGEWYCQLWAESLGKSGVGTTPVIALGPLDQHSQLQLYMEGPKDKNFTFITFNKGSGAASQVPVSIYNGALAELSSLTLHNIVGAMAEGTRRALIETGQPVRHVSINQLDETSIGELFMHFFLETLFAGGLLGVDPYGQPGVERGKTITKEFIQKIAR